MHHNNHHVMGLFDKLFGANNSDHLKDVVNGNALLVDVRSPGEFASGSAKGAINIPMDDVLSKLELFKTDKNVVVFCRSGNRSAHVKEMLERNGIQHVFNGGTWQNVNSLID